MGRPCTVCQHAERREVDRALVAGESFRLVAIRFGLGPASVQRHLNTHVGRAKAKAKAAATHAVVREARAAEAAADVAEAVVEQSRSTLELVAVLRDRAMGYLDKAEQPQPVFAKDGSVVGEEVDWRAVAALLREARGCLEAQAKLLGELRSGTTVEIHTSPPFVEARDVILGALAPYPEALAAVVAALKTTAERKRLGGGR